VGRKIFARKKILSSYKREEKQDMTKYRDDVRLLLQLDTVYLPGIEAKKYAYSSELADTIKSGDFFDRYALDSDQRFYVNEVATYYEMLGLLWRKGIVDEELALEWSATAGYWKRLGAILVKAREVFGSPRLWEYFEALAEAQMQS
jgi:hypothetical protein